MQGLGKKETQIGHMIEIEPQIFWPLILSLFFNTVIQSKSNLKSHV